MGNKQTLLLIGLPKLASLLMPKYIYIFFLLNTATQSAKPIWEVQVTDLTQTN